MEVDSHDIFELVMRFVREIYDDIGDRDAKLLAGHQSMISL